MAAFSGTFLVLGVAMLALDILAGVAVLIVEVVVEDFSPVGFWPGTLTVTCWRWISLPPILST